MTRKHFREVDFSHVCTAWIHINTTSTEMRFEALQNRTVAFCAIGTNPRLEAGELHHPFLQSSQQQQQCFWCSTGWLLPCRAPPSEGKHQVSSSSTGRESSLRRTSHYDKNVLTGPQVQAATAVFLRAADLRGFHPQGGGNILQHTRRLPFSFGEQARVQQQAKACDSISLHFVDTERNSLVRRPPLHSTEEISLKYLQLCGFDLMLFNSVVLDCPEGTELREEKKNRSFL